MNLVIFGEAFAYPPKEGLSQHVISLLFALSTSQKITPILVLSDRGLIAHRELSTLPWKTVLVPPNEFYDYDAMKRILDAEQVDAVQSYNVYQARLIAQRYARERSIPLIMEHHDVEVELSKFLGLEKEAAEANITYQSEIIMSASLNRFLTEADAVQLRKSHSKQAHTFFVLPTLITDYFQGLSFAKRKPNEVLFIGNGGYPPNARAVTYIFNELAPQCPELIFHLVGRGTERYQSENVIGHGLVDDLRDIVKKTSIGIAPLEAGAGLKIKVLHYMSAGMQIVATPIALKGIDSSPNIVESSLDSFAPALKRLAKHTSSPEETRQRFLNKYASPEAVRTLVERYLSLGIVKIPSLPHIARDDKKLAWVNDLSGERIERIVKQPRSFGGIR